MAAGPKQNPFKQYARFMRETGQRRRLGLQAERQRERLRFGEILQLNSTPDVERRTVNFFDEVRGRGDTKQAESQSIQPRVLDPPVVAFAYRGKKFVRGKSQTADRVKLINENHQRFRFFRQRHLADGREQTLARPELRF